MRSVPVRELNRHTADVLARVEQDETIAITRNGRPVAVIAPAEPHPLAALIESAELRTAKGRLPLVGADTSAATDSAGSDAVITDREEAERW